LIIPTEILENPIFLAFIIAVIRNFLGFAEMKFRGSAGKYEVSKLGETVALYEGVFISLNLIPEMPSVVIPIIAIVVDVLRSMKKAFSGD